MSTIKKNFSRHFNTYEDHAVTQRRIAREMLDFLPRYGIKNIFEFGRGTGLLTRELQGFYGDCFVLSTDLSTGRGEIYNDNIALRIFDVNHEIVKNHYNLVASSMALHWADDPLGVLEKMIPKCDHLVVSMAIKGTFAHWESLFNKSPLWPMLDEQKIQKWCDQFGLRCTVKTYEQSFPSIKDFINHQRSTGVYGSTTPPRLPEIRNAVKGHKGTFTEQFRVAFIYSVEN